MADGNRTAPYTQPSDPTPSTPRATAPEIQESPRGQKPAPSPESPRAPVSPRAGFAVGDMVEGNFKNEGLWYVGVIRSKTGGNYNIAYNDGDYETNVPPSRIRTVGSATPAPEVVEPVPEPPKQAEQHSAQEDPKFSIGIRVEGRFGGGDEWFPGTVDDVKSGPRYSIRYDDGDYEADVEEKFVRSLVSAPSSNQSADTQKPVSDHAPASNAFEVNDRVLARYRGMQREYPGIISRVNWGTNTYDINYDDGEREMNVSAELIRRHSPVVIAATETPTPLFEKGTKVLANYKEYGTYYPATIMKVTPTMTATSTILYYDVIYDFGETESVPESCLRSEAPDSDDIPIESRVSVNYNNSGKWLNGTVHSKHDSGYVIHLDDGTVEQNVSPDCIKLLSTSPEPSASKYKIGDAVLANYRQKGTFLPAEITRVNRNNTYDITYNDNKVEYEVSATNIRALEATPPPAPLASAKEEATMTPKTAARKGLGVGWSLVKTAFLKPPAGGGGDNAPLSVNQPVIARYRRQPEWIPGTVIAKRLAGKAFDILYESGEKEYGVPREYIRSLENSTVDATADAPPEKYPEYKVHDKVYGRYLGKGKWYPGVVVYVRKFDGSYDVEYDLPFTPYHDIEKKVKPQYLKYREEEPVVTVPTGTVSEASTEPPQQREQEGENNRQHQSTPHENGSSSSKNVTFSGVDKIKQIEANEEASPTSTGVAATGEKGFDDDLDDFLANLSDDGVDDLDYGGLRTEKAVMLDENELGTEEVGGIENEEEGEEGYYDDFES